MPRLAESFTVIAIDLRGVGGSAAPSDGYAAADLAEDVYQLLGARGRSCAHRRPRHRGWVAYAFSRLHPRSTSTLLIMETPIPGIEPFQHLDIDVPLWHGEFHMIPDLPKALVADRQAIYSRHFFNVGTNDNRVITDADVEHYANAYRDPDHLRSAFEVYRALPANITLNAGSTATVDVPLLLVGGEHVFGPVMPALAENLRAHHSWTDVRVEILKNGGTTCPRSDPTRSPSSSSATPRTGNGPERASRRNGALPDVPTSSPIRSSSPPSPCITSRPDSRTPPGH
jgi:pimeloyl-ACP methyl ester carboxylesterase